MASSVNKEQVPGILNNMVLFEDEKFKMIIEDTPSAGEYTEITLEVKPCYRWRYEGKKLAILSYHEYLIRILAVGTVIDGQMHASARLSHESNIEIIVVTRKAMKTIKSSVNPATNLLKAPCPSYKQGKVCSIIKAALRKLKSEESANL